MTEADETDAIGVDAGQVDTSQTDTAETGTVETDVNGAVYRRVPDLVWRVAEGRVLLHRVGAAGADDAMVELTGPVALIWLALDEPATVGELRERFSSSGVSVGDLGADMARLVAASLVADDNARHRRATASPGSFRIRVFDAFVDVSSPAPLDSELRACFQPLRHCSSDDGAAPTTSGGATISSRLDVAGSGHDGWAVRWNDEPTVDGLTIDLALHQVLNLVNEHAAARATELGGTVLHGGAVSVGGSVVALVGPSRAGKSTLTAALALRGHLFVADEVVAIDADLRVTQFPRPIGLRLDGASRVGLHPPQGPYEHVYPYRVDGPTVDGVEVDGQPLGRIVLLRRSDGAGDVRVDDVEPARALFELANLTLGSAGLEREVFRRLEDLVRRVPVVEMLYGDVAEAVRSVENLSAPT